MVVKIGYDDLKNMLEEYYKDMCKGYDYKIKCFPYEYSTPDGFGFTDDHIGIKATLEISKKITILGSEKVAKESKDIEREVIHNVVAERLKADNVELNFMCPNKSSIELFTKDVELEQTLKKIK